MWTEWEILVMHWSYYSCQLGKALVIDAIEVGHEVVMSLPVGIYHKLQGVTMVV